MCRVLLGIILVYLFCILVYLNVYVFCFLHNGSIRKIVMENIQNDVHFMEANKLLCAMSPSPNYGPMSWARAHHMGSDSWGKAHLYGGNKSSIFILDLIGRLFNRHLVDGRFVSLVSVFICFITGRLFKDIWLMVSRWTT